MAICRETPQRRIPRIGSEFGKLKVVIIESTMRVDNGQLTNLFFSLLIFGMRVMITSTYEYLVISHLLHFKHRSLNKNGQQIVPALPTKWQFAKWFIMLNAEGVHIYVVAPFRKWKLLIGPSILHKISSNSPPDKARITLVLRGIGLVGRMHCTNHTS